MEPELTIEEVKRQIKREFSLRKKTEPGLKLMNVFNDYSRRKGYRDWNTYNAYLKTANVWKEHHEGDTTG